MKAYLFNTENGLYAGECFEEPDMLEYVDGVTPIAPPPYGAGQVPVFDAVQNCWSIVPVALVREHLKAEHVENVPVLNLALDGLKAK